MYWKICFKPLGITMKGSKRNTPKSGFIFCISWEILVKDKKRIEDVFLCHENPLWDSGSDCQCSGKVKLKPWHLTQLGKSHPYRDQRQRQSCLLFTIYLLAVLVSLHNKCFLWLKLQRVTIQTKHVRRDCGKSISKHKNMLLYHVAKCFSNISIPLSHVADIWNPAKSSLPSL